MRSTRFVLLVLLACLASSTGWAEDSAPKINKRYDRQSKKESIDVDLHVKVVNLTVLLYAEIERQQMAGEKVRTIPVKERQIEFLLDRRYEERCKFALLIDGKSVFSSSTWADASATFIHVPLSSLAKLTSRTRTVGMKLCDRDFSMDPVSQSALLQLVTEGKLAPEPHDD